MICECEIRRKNVRQKKRLRHETSASIQQSKERTIDESCAKIAALVYKVAQKRAQIIIKYLDETEKTKPV